jgi:hypothetical protein
MKGESKMNNSSYKPPTKEELEEAERVNKKKREAHVMKAINEAIEAFNKGDWYYPSINMIWAGKEYLSKMKGKIFVGDMDTELDVYEKDGKIYLLKTHSDGDYGFNLQCCAVLNSLDEIQIEIKGRN